jgi:serine/threonine protein kinase
MQNILVASLSPLVVKLGDFGISKRVQNNDTKLQTICGTTAYMAPEIQAIDNDMYSEYTNAVDIWSLGCVLHKTLTGQIPFSGEGIWRYAYGSMDFPVQHLKANCVSVSGIEFIKSLMKKVPETRLSAEQARRAMWVSEADETEWEYVEVESMGNRD